MTSKPTYEELEKRVRELEHAESQRKRTEEKLNESERQFRQVTETIQDVFWMSTPGITKMVYVSPAYEKIWKRNTQLLYESPRSYLQVIHPDDLEQYLAFIDTYHAKGKAYQCEYRILPEPVTMMWIRESGYPITDGNGDTVLMTGVCTDITEIKRIQEVLSRSMNMMSSLLEQSPVPTFLKDRRGRYLFVNRSYAERVDKSQKEVVGLTDYDIVAEPETAECFQSNDNLIFQNHEVIAEESTFTVASGVYSFMTMKFPVFNDKGEVYAVGGVSFDITDRKQMEEQKRQVQKMESIGLLAGGIAHDFNNIMAIIVGNTELALDDVPKWNSAHSSLEEIKKASLRAKNIVKQLLSFSRKADEKLQPIQIGIVIKDALKFLRSTIPTTINIHRDIQTIDETILADPTQINQIIMNLCINASHAMEQTGGDLTVNVEKVILDGNSVKDYPDLKNGDHVKIIVSDTGPGIGPEIIDQIFDPYFTTKEVGKGSGMGLAVVHGIVKNSGGAIGVESSQGKGTKFIIFFPLATEKPMAEAKTLQDIPRGNETILFVDDEISIVKMVQRMFERLGYKVETATTPQDALERFSLNPDHFDLVITDMTMPQMTGVKLSEKLMEICPDIPIIICTGHSALVDEKRAKDLSLAAYIMKPIDMQETAQTIRKVLDKK